MSLREDEWVEAMAALCADGREGERRMLVLSCRPTTVTALTEAGYRVAQAGDVLAVWLEDEAVRMGPEG